jgi:hypothetical protein
MLSVEKHIHPCFIHWPTSRNWPGRAAKNETLWQKRWFKFSRCELHLYVTTLPVNSHYWRKDREVFTTNGTYPWSFVTQIFHSGQPNHKAFEVITLGSVASLLAATLNQGHPDRNHKLWNVVWTERYIPHIGFVTKLIRRVPLVEQELLILRITWVHPRFEEGFVLLHL